MLSHHLFWLLCSRSSFSAASIAYLWLLLLSYDLPPGIAASRQPPPPSLSLSPAVPGAARNTDPAVQVRLCPTLLPLLRDSVPQL